MIRTPKVAGRRIIWLVGATKGVGVTAKPFAVLSLTGVGIGRGWPY